MNTIIDRALSSDFAIIGTVIVVLAVLFVLYKLLKALFDGSGKAFGQVLQILGLIVKEAVGKDAKPYERINVLVLLLLALIAVSFLFLGLAQSLPNLKPPPETLAIFLFLTVLIAGTGVACVRFVSRHEDDLSAAKRLSQTKTNP